MKNLDLLIPTQPNRPVDSWTWATVTQADPLRIRLDGEIDPLPATPDCLFSGAEVGQRVWVQLTGHRVIVHAPSGGAAVDTEPVGVMKMWPTATPPEGYLILDGSTFDAAVYPELNAVLGGNTLPDMRSRFPIGAGSFAGLSENEGLAENLRTTNHNHNNGTLTTGNAGDHDHGSGTLDTSNYTMADSQNTATGGANAGRLQGTPGNITHKHSVTGRTSSTGSHNHSVTGETGTVLGGAESNVPFLGVNFIIKAK